MSGTVGSVPCETSYPSVMPSPSVSGLFGSVCDTLVSYESVSPPSSVSVSTSPRALKLSVLLLLG